METGDVASGEKAATAARGSGAADAESPPLQPQGSVAAAQGLSPAESLRYLRWYSAVIVSHHYALEHAFLTGSSSIESAYGHPGSSSSAAAHNHGLFPGARGQMTGTNAVAVVAAWGAREGCVGWQETPEGEAGQPPPQRRHAPTPRPSAILFIWWARSQAADAAATTATSPASPEALMEAFDEYFFPTYLFPDAMERQDGAADGTHGHGHGGTARGRGGGGGGGAASGQAQLATATELRTAFHEFIALGHKLAFAALAGCALAEARPAASPPCPVTAGHGHASGYLSSASNPGEHELGTTPLSGATGTGLSPVTGLHPQGSGGGAAAGLAGVVGCGGSGTGNAATTTPTATASQPSHNQGSSTSAKSTRQEILTTLYSLAFGCPCAALASAAQLLLAEAMARLSVSRYAHDTHALSFSQAPGGSRQRAAAALAECEETAAVLLMRLLPRVEKPVASAGGAGAGATALTRSGASSPRRSPAGPSAADDLVFTPRAGEALLWIDANGRPHVAPASAWLGGGGASSAADSDALVAAFANAQCVRSGNLPRAPTLPAVDRLMLSTQGLVSGELAAVERAMERAVDVCAQEALFARGGAGGSASRRRRPGQSSSPVASNAPSSPMGGGHQGGAGASRAQQLLCVLSRCHSLVPQKQRPVTSGLLYGIFNEQEECAGYLDVLALYPDVLRAHYVANRYILLEEGPLPLDERLMIAVMAASRHRCEYLVCRYAALLLRFTSSADARTTEEALTAAPTDAAAVGSANSGHSKGNPEGGEGGGNAGRAPHADEGTDSEGESDAGEEDIDAGMRGNRHRRRRRHSAGAPAVCEDSGDGSAVDVGSDGTPQAVPADVSARRRASTTGAAASRHERWLLEGPPPRLQAVQRFIGLAVHTPWRIDEETVREVLHSGWTVPELFQLTAILAHIVPLSAFVMGLGVPVDPWTLAVLPPALVAQLQTQQRHSGGGGGGFGSPSSPSPPLQSSASSASRGRVRQHGSAQDLGRLPKADSQGCLEPALPLRGEGGGDSHDVFTRYTGSDDIVSEQRIKGGSNSVSQHTLWRHQFSWQGTGATCMEQYYPGAAVFLNDEFESFSEVVRQVNEGDCVSLKYAQVSPDYAFQSLKLYVLNVLGFMEEDYPYNEINKVLLRPAKWIAQALTMRPEALSREDVRCWATCAASLPPTSSPSSLLAATESAGRLTTASSSQRVKQEVDLLAAGHKMGPMPSLTSSSATGTWEAAGSSSSGGGGSGGGGMPMSEESATAASAQALAAALELQDNRVLLLIMLATMFAREEGLLHILLRPLCAVLSNM